METLTGHQNRWNRLKSALNRILTLIGIPKRVKRYTDYGDYDHSRKLFQDFARFSLTLFYGYAILPVEYFQG